MRKVLVLLLAILMVFTIVACKQEPEEAEQPQATEAEGKANLLSQGAKGSKAIDHNGFRIVGTFDVQGTKTVIEVGGKDGIYWLGLDEDVNAEIESYYLITEVKSGDVVTLKLWDEGAWDSYDLDSSESVLDALFGDDGVVDQLLYCSFGLEDNNLFDGVFGLSAPASAGSVTKEGRNCTKYTASCTYDTSLLGGTSDMKVAEINLYVDKQFAFTVAMDYSFTDEFKNLFKDLPGVDPEDFVTLSYNATVNLAPTGSALPADYAAAAAAL